MFSLVLGKRRLEQQLAQRDQRIAELEQQLREQAAKRDQRIAELEQQLQEQTSKRDQRIAELEQQLWEQAAKRDQRIAELEQQAHGRGVSRKPACRPELQQPSSRLCSFRPRPSTAVAPWVALQALLVVPLASSVSPLSPKASQHGRQRRTRAAEGGIIFLIGAYFSLRVFRPLPTDLRWQEWTTRHGPNMRIFAPLIVLLGLATMFGVLSPGDSQDWKEFRPPAGGFSVEFPGVPVEETKVQATPAGELTLNRFAVTRRDGDVSYSVGLWRYSPEMIQAGILSTLNTAREAVIGQFKSQPIAEREVKAGQQAGHEILIRKSDKFLIRTRIFIVADRLYTVMVAAPETYVQDPDANRFLDSFMPLSG
jgi:hypothetical protein